MKLQCNATDGQTVLPTFFQWCKSTKGQKTAERYYVTKMWMPNKYPDLTLETEVFRLRVSHKSTLFTVLSDEIKLLESEGKALAICEIDKENYDFTLETPESEQCEWEALGDFGRRLTIKARPIESRRKPK